MNSAFSRWLLVLSIVALSAAVALDAHADVPRTIQYSGALSVEGAPMNGNAELIFELFSGESGGRPLWGETLSRHPVTDGHFSVELGKQSSLLPILDGDALWLEVTVNGIPLSPRQQVTSIPYAIRAGDSSTLGGHEPADFLRSDAIISADSINYRGESTYEVQSALDELYALVDGLTEAVSIQSGELSALQVERDAAILERDELASRLADLEGWAEDTDTALADAADTAMSARTLASQSMTLISDMDTSISLASLRISQLTTRVETLEDTGPGGGASSEALDLLTDRVDTLEADFGALETNVSSFEDSLIGFETDLQSLETGLSATNTEVSSMEYTVDYMQLDLGNLTVDVRSLEEWQDDTVDPALLTLSALNDATLPARVTQLETDVIGLDSDFGSLESFVYSELGDLEDDVSSLTTTVSGIGDDVSDLNTWKLSAEATLIAHNTRITDIEDWRTDYADDAIEYDIPELLERTQYQRAELVGGLPGLIFEGTNVYVRSGNADYLGNDSCRPAPPVAMGEPGGGEHHVIQGAPVRTKISDGGGPCYRDPINGELCEDEVISESCDLYDQEGAGLGNLVIGYGKPTYDDSLISGGMDDDDLDNGFKHGMHNLVIGLGHDWRATYGILHGNHHIFGQDYAAIVGGRENFLEHQYTSGTFEHQGAAIFGGWGNYVYTNMATLVGGYYHQAWDLEWGEAEFGSLDGD